MSIIHKPHTRRGKAFAAALGAVLAFSIGAAIAAFISRAPIEGGVQSSPFEPSWTGAPSIQGAEDMSCMVSRSGRTLNLQVTSAYPTGWCDVVGLVYLPSVAAEEGKIAGIDLNLPAGWTATFPQAGDCGRQVVRSDGANGTAVRINHDGADSNDRSADHVHRQRPADQAAQQHSRYAVHTDAII
jgi:hypothetical protein